MPNLTDNSLIELFLPIMQAGLIADGFATAKVKQANQPTIQGINTVPTVYFFKLANVRYGYLGRQDAWNGMSSQMIHTESQYYEATFQVFALVLQNPSDLSIPTASDLVNDVASIMQSDTTRSILNASGVGILRVTDVRNPYFQDDRDNFEASPSFDFTLTYQNARTNVIPVVSSFVDIIEGV